MPWIANQKSRGIPVEFHPGACPRTHEQRVRQTPRLNKARTVPCWGRTCTNLYRRSQAKVPFLIRGKNLKTGLGRDPFRLGPKMRQLIQEATQGKVTFLARVCPAGAENAATLFNLTRWVVYCGRNFCMRHHTSCFCGRSAERCWNDCSHCCGPAQNPTIDTLPHTWPCRAAVARPQRPFPSLLRLWGRPSGM